MPERIPPPGRGRRCRRSPRSVDRRRRRRLQVAARPDRAAAEGTGSPRRARRQPRRRTRRRRKAAHRVLPARTHPPRDAPAPAPSAEPASGGAGPGYAVPCGLAGEYVFCADCAVRFIVPRATARAIGSWEAAVWDRGSPRRRSAGTHSVLGYLASRQTSEGWVSEAWLVADDASPVRLSEDGSGATSLALAQRGPAVLALTVDARAALTAMHARPVTFEGGRAHLGEDAVVFVGGPGDRRTHGALLTPSQGPTSAAHDPAWALLPIAKDVGGFGLALVRLDDPPHVDEPVSWSMYENGLDPAPVAAATAAGQSWAARVVPRDASPTSARQLELGSIAPERIVHAARDRPHDGKTVGRVADGRRARRPLARLGRRRRQLARAPGVPRRHGALARTLKTNHDSDDEPGRRPAAATPRRGARPLPQRHPRGRRGRVRRARLPRRAHPGHRRARAHRGRHRLQPLRAQGRGPRRAARGADRRAGRAARPQPGDPRTFPARLTVRVARVLGYVRAPPRLLRHRHRARPVRQRGPGGPRVQAQPAAASRSSAPCSTRCVQEGVASGDLERAARATRSYASSAGTMRAFVLSSLAEQTADVDEQARTVVDLFLHGAGRRKAESARARRGARAISRLHGGRRRTSRPRPPPSRRAPTTTSSRTATRPSARPNRPRRLPRARRRSRGRAGRALRRGPATCSSAACGTGLLLERIARFARTRQGHRPRRPACSSARAPAGSTCARRASPTSRSPTRAST